jgi:hypothetical protein
MLTCRERLEAEGGKGASDTLRADYGPNGAYL